MKLSSASRSSPEPPCESLLNSSTCCATLPATGIFSAGVRPGGGLGVIGGEEALGTLLSSRSTGVPVALVGCSIEAFIELPEGPSSLRATFAQGSKANSSSSGMVLIGVADACGSAAGSSIELLLEDIGVFSWARWTCLSAGRSIAPAASLEILLLRSAGTGATGWIWSTPAWGGATESRARWSPVLMPSSCLSTGPNSASPGGGPSRATSTAPAWEPDTTLLRSSASPGSVSSSRPSISPGSAARSCPCRWAPPESRSHPNVDGVVVAGNHQSRTDPTISEM